MDFLLKIDGIFLLFMCKITMGDVTTGDIVANVFDVYKHEYASRPEVIKAKDKANTHGKTFQV